MKDIYGIGAFEIKKVACREVKVHNAFCFWQCTALQLANSQRFIVSLTHKLNRNFVQTTNDSEETATATSVA